MLGQICHHPEDFEAFLKKAVEVPSTAKLSVSIPVRSCAVWSSSKMFEGL